MINVWGHAVRLYNRITPSTISKSVSLIIVLLSIFFLFTIASMGFLNGAGAAVNAEPLNTDEISALEQDIWVDMGQGNSLERSVYGVFHWLVALSIMLARLASELGYSMPSTAYLLVWPIRVMPLPFVLLIAVQLVRIFELTYAKTGSLASDRGADHEC